jgi:hypothetical protein
MIKGRCLCGEVRYELAGELGPIVFCHCSQCRRASGSAFATNAPIQSSELTFVAGQGRIKEFESSPGKFRAFCGTCGSPLYSRRDDLPARMRLRIGTVETTIAARPTAHIYASSKPEWDEIHDELPRHDGSA